MDDITFEQWVKALRSGDYKQTRGTLKGELPDGGTGFCCLGVLAEIMGYEVEKENFKTIYEDFKEFFENSFLVDLVSMNDKGKTFEEIADRIEEEIEND